MPTKFGRRKIKRPLPIRRSGCSTKRSRTQSPGNHERATAGRSLPGRLGHVIFKMAALQFQSTNGQSPAVNLREALLAGQAPDRGLYFPEKFPRIPVDELAAFARLPYH